MAASRIETYVQLAELIAARPARCGKVRLVAVDGPGGAGKSVFAERLARSLGDAPVLRTDDFASWDNPLNWWSSLEELALQPLGRGQRARFPKSSWGTETDGHLVEVAPADVVVLEGVSSSRRAVADRLSLAVWIQAPREVRLRRGTERDGVDMRDQWDEWMAEEDAHFAEDEAAARADVVVDGDPSIPHDADSEYVRLL